MSAKKILFVSEAVTLAQIVRLSKLASCLDPGLYEVHFACADFDEMIFKGLSIHRWPIRSISKTRLMSLVESGRSIYNEQTLSQYIEDELTLFNQINPDVVVGDLRWSLAVSAPVAQVKYFALVNAYWHPMISIQDIPVPDHPIIKVLGEKMTARFFPKALPHAFEYYARPLNNLRKRYGLNPIGSLREILTFADLTLFPDVKEMFDYPLESTTKKFIGPVLWAPKVDLPVWWNEWIEDKPLVYVTLGSSGRIDALPTVLEALKDLPVRVAVSSAGRLIPSSLRLQSRAQVRFFDYLPGDLVSRQATLVICNGGSTTGYQALNEGTPIIGLASNLDQFLASTFIEKAGAGLCLKARAASVLDVRSSALRLIKDESFKNNANKIYKWFNKYDSLKSFGSLLESVC